MSEKFKKKPAHHKHIRGMCSLNIKADRNSSTVIWYKNCKKRRRQQQQQKPQQQFWSPWNSIYKNAERVHGTNIRMSISVTF